MPEPFNIEQEEGVIVPPSMLDVAGVQDSDQQSSLINSLVDRITMLERKVDAMGGNTGEPSALDIWNHLRFDNDFGQRSEVNSTDRRYWRLSNRYNGPFAMRMKNTGALGDPWSIKTGIIYGCGIGGDNDADVTPVRVPDDGFEITSFGSQGFRMELWIRIVLTPGGGPLTYGTVENVDWKWVPSGALVASSKTEFWIPFCLKDEHDEYFQYIWGNIVVPVAMTSTYSPP